MQIRFHGIDASDALSAHITELAEKLGHIYDRIERCEVVLESPNANGSRSPRFHVRIRLHVPGDDVIIDRDPGRDDDHNDAYVAVNDAFDAARRRLETRVERMRDVRPRA